MIMDKKELDYVTSSPEEDILFVSTEPYPPIMTLTRYVIIILMSIIILGVYLFMNHMFFPGYPVINTFAEKNESFAENYPPFRMNEWIYYSISDEIISGSINDVNSFSKIYPIGFSFLAVPLTMKYGEIGIYYTNSFILWLCALVFFSLMMHIIRFPLAVAFTFVLAFATPNLFFASSAYSEPTSQLLILISIYFLIKGLTTNSELYYYSLCGLAIGLNIFVNPSMVLAMVFFSIVIIAERSEWTWKNKGVVFLFSGFCFAIIMFFVLYRIAFGHFPTNIFSYLKFQTYNLPQNISDSKSNLIVGIWKLLFDSPHGLIFIMPVTMLVPMGIIIMWRKKLRSVTIITGTMVLYAIFYAAFSCCLITEEGVGTRLLLPILPLLIMPLAFVWEKETGERLWLAFTLILTVYMCSFGWWTGIAREEGFFIGILHDRDARYILLARKNKLEKLDFNSSNGVVRIFFDSLKKGDIKRWLQTLDRESIDEIRGFERVIFNDLMIKNRAKPGAKDLVIESVDPDKGINLIIPEIIYNPDNPDNLPY